MHKRLVYNISKLIGDAAMTKTIHLTIENVERLAALIVSKIDMPMKDARELAEFNLRYSKSYADAAARVA